MNRMVAGRNGVRHGRGHYAEGAEFDASDVDAKYYEDRGMASRKQAEPVAQAEPEPRRRGRPPSYQTRQMQAEPRTAEPESRTAQPLSTQTLPPEHTQE